MAKLSQEDYEYRRTENSVSSINYHFVFVPKRRRSVLVKDVAKRLQEIIFDLVTEHGWKLIALEIMPDHVHLFVNTPTHESPADVARWVKGRASHYLTGLTQLSQAMARCNRAVRLNNYEINIGTTGRFSCSTK